MSSTDAAGIDLTGRRIVVTGAGSGIGRAIAAAAARAGASVIAAGRRAEPLRELAAGHADAVQPITADVTQDGSVDELITAADDRLGGLDGVVHAAGVHDTSPSHELSTERFASVVDVNLTGAFRISRAAAPALARHNGSIVHIASLASYGGFPGRLAYGVAKAGVVELTKTLAVEWGPWGIRVNAVAPGFVRTPIAADLERRGVLDVAQIERRTPLRRRAEPADLAGPVLFLLSEAAAYVTGECLLADGGWLALAGPVDALGDQEAPDGQG